MSLTFYWAVSVFLIAFGGLLLLRKKIMIWRGYDMLFLLITASHPSLATDYWTLKELFFLYGSYLLLGLFSLFLIKGKYTIYNVNSKMVSAALASILKDSGLTYEVGENSILIEDNENKTIKFKQSMNSVEVNFRDVTKLPIYEKIRGELKIQIKQIETTVFPASGVFTFALGVILLSVVQFAKRLGI